MNATTPIKNRREPTWDILRGIALLIMLAANLAGECLAVESPLWVRWVFSLAAPLFVILAGFMVAYTASVKQHPWHYYIGRGLFIVGAAVFADSIIWGYYPFESFDVLYVLGLVVMSAGALTKTPSGLQWLIPLLFILATPLLQQTFGYSQNLVSHPLTTPWQTVINDGQTYWQQWAITGWFPVFPWLGIGLLGVPLYSKYCHWKGLPSSQQHQWLWVTIAALFAIGGTLWVQHPGPLYTREGYVELFYPMTLGFTVLSIAAVLLLFGLVNRYAQWPLFQPATTLGKLSLLVYLTHGAIIHFILSPLFPELFWGNLIAVYLSFCLVMVTFASLVYRFKQRHPEKVTRFKSLLGS